MQRKLVCMLLTMLFLFSMVSAVAPAAYSGDSAVPNIIESGDNSIAALNDDTNQKLPMSMLVYTEFADHDESSFGELKNTLTIINDNFLNDYHIDNMTDYKELPNVIMNYDVVLLPEQEKIMDTNISDIANAWDGVFEEFVTNGGVLVVMPCYGQYTSDPYAPLLQIFNQTGFIPYTAAYAYPGTTFNVNDSDDALARGIPSTFSGTDGSTRMNGTGGTVVVDDGIGPIVVHKTMGSGHIALVGFDLYLYGDAQVQILINAIQLTRHVIFDTSHNPYHTIHAGLLNYSLDLVSEGFAVSSMSTFEQGTIDACDVLVIYASTSFYSEAEVDIIEDFVSEGGGLFILTDWGPFGEELDNVTSRFGFEREPDRFINETDDYDSFFSYNLYNTSDFQSHSIMLKVSDVELDKGTGFHVIPENAIPLITGDTDGTIFWDDGSPADGIILAAAAGYGLGRVTVLSDHNIMNRNSNPDGDADSNYFDANNELFLVQNIRWAAGGGVKEKFVVFDESNQANWWLNASYFGFGQFLTDNGYTIRWMWEWDSMLLEQTHVLVVQDCYDNYTTAEISEIEAFVQMGGGLVLLGGSETYGQQADYVGNEFGLDLNNTGYMEESGDDYLDGDSMNIFYNQSNFGVHPIMDGVLRIELYKSTAFIDIGDGVSLLETDSDGTARWNDGTPADGLTLMTALEFGHGRVFFSGDYMFPKYNSDYDSDGVPILYDSDNDVLLTNVFAWLTVDRAPVMDLISPNGGESVDDIVEISWDAFDPNKDEITITLFYSSTGGPDWVLIDSELTGSTYMWDTSGLTDGTDYLILAVAYDEVFNDEDGSQSVFTVDNHGPDINPLAIGTWPTPELPVPVSANITDISGVVSVICNFSTDGGLTWNTTNMVLDSGDAYTTNIGPFVNGTTVEYKIVAEDGMGHISETTLDVFTVIEPPPEGGDNTMLYIIIIAGVVVVIIIIIIIMKKKS